jgi:predicted dehydrogenase
MAKRDRRPAIRVALVGIHGHGRWHLGEIHRLAARNDVELVGVCDPKPPAGDLVELVRGATWTPEVAELLSTTNPEVTVLATPIHTHVDLALQVARSGSHLLLEKPPAPSIAEFERLVSGVDDAGVACQVGFQSLGSGAAAGLGALIADGVLGTVRGIGAAGIYVRDAGYFGRSAWAGHRRLGDADVVDGVLSNPFVHAVATAIRVAGAEIQGAIAGTELELYRANQIESDDTSVARLVTTSGLTIVIAATLCAGREEEPVITVHGTTGRASWPYRNDAVTVVTDSGVRTLAFERTGLLENLVAHVLDPDVALLVPLAGSRAVTEFVDDVRRAPDPLPIAARLRRSRGEGDRLRWIVGGVEDAVNAAAAQLTVFAEQPAPWAVAAAGEATVPLTIDGHRVADYQVAPGVDPTLSPRPFLHPVRTLGGTEVSDCGRDDHRWHLGVGVAIQDVGGINFWGGRTYVAGRGYEWCDDHGSIRHLAWTRRDGGVLDHDLAWMGPDRRCRLVERRTLSAEAVRRSVDRWVLALRFALRNTSGAPLALQSPGSHGRVGGGYGGFFWRLPLVTGSYTVCTERGVGEEAVHGRVAPWLAWTAETADRGRSFTLLAAPDDLATAGDPWFVRLADYPGFGSALAWDHPLDLEAGETVTRSVRVLVVDGAGHDPTGLYDDLIESRTPCR